MQAHSRTATDSGQDDVSPTKGRYLHLGSNLSSSEEDSQQVCLLCYSTTLKSTDDRRGLQIAGIFNLLGSIPTIQRIPYLSCSDAPGHESGGSKMRVSAALISAVILKQDSYQTQDRSPEHEQPSTTPARKSAENSIKPGPGIHTPNSERCKAHPLRSSEHPCFMNYQWSLRKLPLSMLIMHMHQHSLANVC